MVDFHIHFLFVQYDYHMIDSDDSDWASLVRKHLSDDPLDEDEEVYNYEVAKEPVVLIHSGSIAFRGVMQSLQ